MICSSSPLAGSISIPVLRTSAKSSGFLSALNQASPRGLFGVLHRLLNPSPISLGVAFITGCRRTNCRSFSIRTPSNSRHHPRWAMATGIANCLALSAISIIASIETCTLRETQHRFLIHYFRSAEILVASHLSRERCSFSPERFSCNRAIVTDGTARSVQPVKLRRIFPCQFSLNFVGDAFKLSLYYLS